MSGLTRFRAFCRFFVVSVVLAAALCAHPAQAGLLSGLLRHADDVGGVAKKAGKHLDDFPSLDAGAGLARRLAGKADHAQLALIPHAEDGWRLVGANGNHVPLGDLDELSSAIDLASTKAIKPLAGDVASKAVKRSKAQIAIREQDFFKLREQLVNLPDTAQLHFMRNTGKSYPLKTIVHEGRKRLAVELSKSTLLNPASVRALDQNLKYLTKSFNPADLKIARFESGEAALKAASTYGERVSVLNLDLLESSLAKFKLRTLVIGGKPVRDPVSGAWQLSVKAGGKSRKIDLAELEAAAARQRVNLIVSETGSAVQPGKALLGKSELEKRFEALKGGLTQEDLLTALAPKNGASVINAAQDGASRLVMNFRQMPAEGAVSGVGQAGDYTLSSWLTDAGVRAGTHVVRANIEDPDVQEEIEGRWIPWVGNMTLVASVVGLVVMIFVGQRLWKWYAAFAGFLARKFAFLSWMVTGSLVLRVLVFVPFALIIFVPGMIWIVIGDYVRFFSWPFRKLFGLFRKA